MNKELFKNSFIYILGDVLNKAVPFLMLPVLTRYLTPEDYGILSVFGVFVAILAVFTGLSIHGIINVNFFKMSKDTLKIFIGNCIIILNISSFIVLILVYIFYPLIIERLNIELEWILVAVVMAFAQFITTINLLLWTAEKQPIKYSIYQISQTLMNVLISLVLIVGFSMNWEGRVIAMAISTIIFSIISFVFIVKRGYIVFQPSKEYMSDALKFGIPLIPHSLGAWIATGADRILLMSILGASITGIYAVGYQLGIIMSVIVSSFNKAWIPYLYKILSNNPTIKDKKKIIKFTYFYFVSILCFAGVFSYIVAMVTPFLLGEKFIDATQFVIYFAFAFAFQGMYFMVTNYIFYIKKTNILAYITLGTAVLHLGILYILIRINGVIGAAQANLIFFIILFISVWFLSNKFYKMPWRIWR